MTGGGLACCLATMGYEEEICNTFGHMSKAYVGQGCRYFSTVTGTFVTPCFTTCDVSYAFCNRGNICLLARLLVRAGLGQQN